MKQFFLFLVLALIYSVNYAQKIPQLTFNDSLNVRLSELKIDVSITGNYAKTTYDMTFYNELNQTLEGELVFPLGLGQSVSEFGMELNGKIRKASVVEKQLARVAYEQTIKQKIDPALLEKTEGNNYRARVYPITPNAEKRIILSYEEILNTNEGLKQLNIPIETNELLKNYHITINHSNREKKLLINSIEHQGNYTLKKKNYTPKPITVSFEVEQNKTQVNRENNYFSIYQPLSPENRQKNKPKSIVLLWDSSFSMLNRNKTLEMDLLEQYFQSIEEVSVTLIPFNIKQEKQQQFEIKNGQWKQLKQALNEVVYDGATRYNNIFIPEADEILLFSDGLSNFEHQLKTKDKIYAINSIRTANYELLNRIATKSGGQFINLISLSTEAAIKKLNTIPYQFIGIKENKSLAEVYPKNKQNVTNDFYLTGQFNSATTIFLQFGYGGKVTETIPVKLTQKRAQNNLVKRLWAKQKLAHLNINKKENKEQIITHCVNNHLISDYTSMIVLDRVEDYARYKIEPPKELLKEYKELLKEREEKELDRQEEFQDRKEDIQDDYETINQWYKTKFQKKQKKDKVIRQESNTSNEQPVNNATNEPIRNQEPETNPIESETPQRPIRNRNLSRELDSTKNIVSGTVYIDEDTCIACTIRIKDTNYGTLSNIDGEYALNAELNDVLIFTYVGSKTKEVTVDKNRIDVTLESDVSLLEEVVVTAYSQVERRQVTSSVVIQGQVAGLDIQTNSAENLQIRGQSSINASAQPLYVIDGVVTTQDTSTLSTEQISSIQIIKGADATALFGSKGNNGVIVIITKEGQKSSSEKIEQLSKQIEEKIDLKEWSPDTPYLKQLQQIKSTEKAYKKYLELRNDYRNVPAFYLDIAHFFYQKKDEDKALKVITNLLEIDLNNYELYRALAYQLESLEQNHLATKVYEKLLEIRPEDIQSYRDLALAYEQTGEYQKAFDLLYKIYNGDFMYLDEDENYYGIEHSAYIELCHLVHNHYKQIKKGRKYRKKLPKLSMDIKVTIDWNHNDTDIDLHITEPTEEVANYKNTETKIGGYITEDMLEGFGPESYLLKNAKKGTYTIEVDYYSDNQQKLSGPTIIKLTTFTNYGRENETKKVTTIRLDKEDDDNLTIGNIQFIKRHLR